MLKPVDGFFGHYSITEDGRVWSHRRTARGRDNSQRAIGGRWLRPVLVKGYPVVHLAAVDGSGISNFYVHRLVAITWGADIVEDGNVVNHKNGQKAEAGVSNLEWCTQSYNVAHAYANGLRTQRRRFTRAEVDAIRAARRSGETFRSLAERFHASVSTIWLAAENKTYDQGLKNV